MEYTTENLGNLAYLQVILMNNHDTYFMLLKTRTKKRYLAIKEKNLFCQ